MGIAHEYRKNEKDRRLKTIAVDMHSQIEWEAKNVGPIYCFIVLR